MKSIQQPSLKKSDSRSALQEPSKIHCRFHESLLPEQDESNAYP
jgi:hypothetical protein